MTLFSKDIGMKFGVDKCAFVKIEKGKQIQNPGPLIINDLIVKPLPTGDTYTYLGIDENITYDGPMKKSKNNKRIPTVGIIDWTIDEIEQLDIDTRKILSMMGNLHPNSDIDYKYMLVDLMVDVV